jgi:hypothetical protein
MKTMKQICSKSGNIPKTSPLLLANILRLLLIKSWFAPKKAAYWKRGTDNQKLILSKQDSNKIRKPLAI